MHLLRGRFYYGWVIVATLIVAGFTQVGEYNPALSVFIDPFEQDFGWSRSDISLAVTIGTFAGGIISPFSGWILDRYGARSVLLVCQVIYGAALISLGFLQGSLMHFIVAYGIGRAAVTGGSLLAIQVAIANWFVRRRGRAMGIARMGDRLSQAIAPALVALMARGWGWRNAWIALGVSTFAIATLPTFLLVRRRPEDMGLMPDGDPVPIATAGAAPTAAELEEQWTLREALHVRSFWLILCAAGGVAFIGPGINLHFLPFNRDSGFSLSWAVGIVSLLYVTGSAGAFLGGLLQDRFPLRWCMGGFFLGTAVMMFLLGQHLPLWYNVVFAIGFGFFFGGITTYTAVMWSSYFGRRSVGKIMGFAVPFQFIIGAASPLFAGWQYDTTGGYSGAFVLWGLTLGLAAVASFAAAKPRRALAERMAA